jgi:hypothetical protein
MYFVKYLNFRSLETKNNENNDNSNKYITINTETEEEAPLITRQNNYENDPRLFHDHIYESN